jgi:hypothetical protein
VTSQLELRLPGNRQLRTNGLSEWTAARSIRLFGVRVGIQTNQPELLERLADYFPPLWQPVAASTVDRIFSLRIGKTSHTAFEDGEQVLKARSLKRVLEDFERRLKMYVAEMARRRVFVHAGAVGWKGKAIIIPGRSYSGKTTLVRELVRAGATYYSDEYAVLDMQGRLHPYPQSLAIRQNGSYTQRKHPVETLGGVVGNKPLPIGLVIVSKYRENARWRPVKLTAGHGVLALLDNTVPARRKPEVVLPVLQKAVGAATILKGDRREAEKIVHRILEKYA